MLRITDNVDDALLQANINAACATIDEICRRSFSADTLATARQFHPASHAIVRIDDVSTLNGFVVKIDNDDDGLFEEIVTSYSVEPANALAKSYPLTRLVATDVYWPIGIRPSVEITAKWGWPAVPEPVKSAAMILAGRLFKRGDSLLGVAGMGDLGAIMLRAVDPDVDRMLAPYVRPAVY
jgi:hypothetical protein